MEGVERVWHRRLRWRLRGAWQWPAFLALTLVDAVLLVLLPPYDGAPEHLFPGVLLAGFANLLAIVVLAPPLGRAAAPPPARPAAPRGVELRRRLAASRRSPRCWRPPAWCTGRPCRPRTARQQAVAAAMHAYVVEQAPEHRDSLGAVDTIRIDHDYYRACIPGDDARHWFCLFVTTDQHPPGVTRDTEEVSNSEAYRPYGGFD